MEKTREACLRFLNKRVKWSPSSGHLNGEPPSTPQHEEKGGEEYRQTCCRGPKLDGAAGGVGDCFAGSDENDVKNQ